MLTGPPPGGAGGVHGGGVRAPRASLASRPVPHRQPRRAAGLQRRGGLRGDVGEEARELAWLRESLLQVARALFGQAHAYIHGLDAARLHSTPEPHHSRDH